MPIYEYECLQCGKQSEVLQKMNDAPLTTCSECGGELKKLLSAPSFQFKGSGFYATDYAAKKTAKGGDSKPESSGGDGAQGEKASGERSKTESKGAETAKVAAPASASKGTD